MQKTIVLYNNNESLKQDNINKFTVKIRKLVIAKGLNFSFIIINKANENTSCISKKYIITFQ